MKRFIILAVLLLAVVGIAGYLAWTRIHAFQEQLGELHQQISELEGEVREAEVRADRAEERADRAEQAILEAQGKAEEARKLAAESAEHAFESNRVRLLAEEERKRAEEERRRAEERAEAARTEAEQAQARIEELRRRREAELQRLDDALSQIAETRRTAAGLVMNLSSDRIEFDFDKANLRPENRELLSRIVGVLLTASDYRIEVYGHTDDVGTEEYNQQLSERRAKAVRDYLVANGVDPDIITTKGYGKSKPLVEGTDPASRQRNRRVEIAITQTLMDFAPAAGNEGR